VGVEDNYDPRTCSGETRTSSPVARSESRHSPERGDDHDATAFDDLAGRRSVPPRLRRRRRRRRRSRSPPRCRAAVPAGASRSSFAGCRTASEATGSGRHLGRSPPDSRRAIHPDRLAASGHAEGERGESELSQARARGVARQARCHVRPRGPSAPAVQVLAGRRRRGPRVHRASAARGGEVAGSVETR
jgi:hypothetical protein